MIRARADDAMGTANLSAAGGVAKKLRLYDPKAVETVKEEDYARSGFVHLDSDAFRVR